LGGLEAFLAFDFCGFHDLASTILTILIVVKATGGFEIPAIARDHYHKADFTLP
jgi:hypothetical protein